MRERTERYFFNELQIQLHENGPQRSNLVQEPVNSRSKPVLQIAQIPFLRACSVVAQRSDRSENDRRNGPENAKKTVKIVQRPFKGAK